MTIPKIAESARNHFKALIAVGLLGLLAGCIEPTQNRACPAELTCLLSQAVAEEINADRGMFFGPGVRLARARALGPTVLMDIQFAFVASSLSAAELVETQRQVAPLFATGICQGENIQTFFDVGGDYRVRLLDINKIEFVDFTIRSCEGN
jgi:hypothetical protein